MVDGTLSSTPPCLCFLALSFSSFSAWVFFSFLLVLYSFLRWVEVERFILALRDLHVFLSSLYFASGVKLIPSGFWGVLVVSVWNMGNF